MTPAAESDRTGWIGPLAMALASQTTVAFLTRIIPTLAPALILAISVGPSFIGYLVASGTIGSMLFYLVGMPLIRRVGSVRIVQFGMLAAGLGTVLLTSSLAIVLVFGSFLIGVGYAPSTPAGSDVLQRFAPKKHRALIFSIKQAGVPLGGMLAGMMLPALVLIDLRLAIVASAALALLVTLAIQPWRERIDRERDTSQDLSISAFLAPENLSMPLNALRMSSRIPPIVFASFCLAAAQGASFAFMTTFLVAKIGLDLTNAGIIFSIVQVTGILGRVVLGGLADRLGSATSTLCATAAASSLTTIAFACVTPDWPFWSLSALAALSGITISSWNGLMLSEVAAIVPLARVAEATAGTTLLVFLGYVVGPMMFSIILDVMDSYQSAFLSLSALTAIGAVVLARASQRISSSR